MTIRSSDSFLRVVHACSAPFFSLAESRRWVNTPTQHFGSVYFNGLFTLQVDLAIAISSLPGQES